MEIPDLIRQGRLFQPGHQRHIGDRGIRISRRAGALSHATRVASGGTIHLGHAGRSRPARAHRRADLAGTWQGSGRGGRGRRSHNLLRFRHGLGGGSGRARGGPAGPGHHTGARAAHWAGTAGLRQLPRTVKLLRRSCLAIDNRRIRRENQRHFGNRDSRAGHRGRGSRGSCSGGLRQLPRTVKLLRQSCLAIDNRRIRRRDQRRFGNRDSRAGHRGRRGRGTFSGGLRQLPRIVKLLRQPCLAIDNRRIRRRDQRRFGNRANRAGHRGRGSHGSCSGGLRQLPRTVKLARQPCLGIDNRRIRRRDQRRFVYRDSRAGHRGRRGRGSCSGGLRQLPRTVKLLRQPCLAIDNRRIRRRDQRRFEYRATRACHRGRGSRGAFPGEGGQAKACPTQGHRGRGSRGTCCGRLSQLLKIVKLLRESRLAADNGRIRRKK